MSGKVLDSVTGLPALAERVTLCCLDSALWKRFSTPLRSDGSFEFAGVPRGRYELTLEARTGQSKLFVVDPKVEVADTPVSGLTFLSTPQLTQLRATVVFENGNPLPAADLSSLVFTSTSGRVRVVALHNGSLEYSASVPTGDQYTASVPDLPERYSVKSNSGPVVVMRIPQAANGALLVVSSPIVITIAPSTP